MDCKQLGTVRTGIAFLLLVNISIAIFVICWVTSSPKTETIQQQDSLQTSIEKAIANTETSNLYSVLPRETKHETESLPLEILNLLKPFFHQTGLNFNQRDKHEQFQVRSWAVTNGAEENQMHNGFRYENGWDTIMACHSESRGTKRVLLIAVFFILMANVLTAITAICLVTNIETGVTRMVQDKTVDFKRSVDKKYEVLIGDFHSTMTRRQKQVRAAPSLEFLSLLKPVFHLAGLDFDQLVAGKRKKSTVRNWAISEGSERNLMYNGITYENGSIIVPVTGVYLMYSHTKFYVEDNKKGTKNNYFYHGLFKYSALTKTEEILASNKVTECKEGINDGAHLEYPSDIRIIVHLNAGDQIVAKVSNFNLLKHDRDWHYIGGYLI